jgi:cell wall-associated NlpC family hydrolase
MALAPWAGRYVGRSYDEVTPCWGLAREIYAREFGIELPTYGPRCPNAADAAEVALLVSEERHRDHIWQAVAAGDEEPGDVILLRARGFPAHVGIVVGDHLMLHCECDATTTREDYHRIHWKGRVVGFYRHEAKLGKEGRDGTAE